MKSIMLLLALMVSNIASASSELARLTAARYDVTSIQTALGVFAVDCGRYPTTSEGIAALINCPTNISSGRWRGPYLDPAKIPTDPWGDVYVYRCPGIHNTNGFDLYSCGADQISKTGGSDPDDINNWDPNSPHGDFSDHVGTYAVSAIRYLFSVAFLLALGLSIMARFSQRVRNRVAMHATACKLLFWLLALGLVLLLICLAIPRIV
jgi:general secretion pathway protein G